jgi:tetratricopeptide (TPR) repeat protein
VRAETRHQLKQDRFSKATLGAAEKTFDWSLQHRSGVILGTIIVLVLAGTGFGAWSYFTQQDQKASLALAQAVRTLDTPIREAGAPPQPEFPSFASLHERATQAHKQFQEVVQQYPHTRSGEVSRYFLGLTSAQLGDNAAAARDLEAVAASRNSDLAASAKFALAGVYRDQGKTKEAIALYQALVATPTTTVSKAMAEMELASTYEANGQPVEAKNIYQQIQKEDPASSAAQLAGQKLQTLK